MIATTFIIHVYTIDKKVKINEVVNLNDVKTDENQSHGTYIILIII
jgi:hypothetical protein